MQKKPIVSIIIPVRSEEETIVSTLEDITKHVTCEYEVLVVDDRVSKDDRTGEVVRAYGKKHPSVMFIQKKLGKETDGFSHALKRGVEKANGKYVVFVMADGCDEIALIDAMLEKAKTGVDVVCGSRYIRGGKKIGGPKAQGFFSFAVNMFLYYAIHIPTRDSSNAFKMYNKKLVTSLDFTRTTGLETSLDLAVQAYLKGATFAEFPTVWLGRTKGSSKFRFISQAKAFSIVTYRALRAYLGRS